MLTPNRACSKSKHEGLKVFQKCIMLISSVRLTRFQSQTDNHTTITPKSVGFERLGRIRGVRGRTAAPIEIVAQMPRPFTSVCGTLFVFFDGSEFPIGILYAYFALSYLPGGGSRLKACVRIRLAGKA